MSGEEIEGEVLHHDRPLRDFPTFRSRASDRWAMLFSLFATSEFWLTDPDALTILEPDLITFVAIGTPIVHALCIAISDSI